MILGKPELMLTINPFADLSAFMSPAVMKTFVVLMIIFVIGGTLFDVAHKKSAKYFFDNWRKSKEKGSGQVGGIGGIAVKTAIEDVAMSGEFCNQKRRIAHLLTMYGFILFVITTFFLVFGVHADEAPTSSGFTGFLWHVGALMVCVGGYWFWFVFRVDVAAEGGSPFRLMRADLFVLSLIATCTFALLWSFFQAVGAGALGTIFFVLFIIAALILFGGVPWSKFSHMFFKPAAALQKRVSEADGSRSNLPAPADKPEVFGSTRESASHY